METANEVVIDEKQHAFTVKPELTTISEHEEPPGREYSRASTCERPGTRPKLPSQHGFRPTLSRDSTTVDINKNETSKLGESNVLITEVEDVENEDNDEQTIQESKGDRKDVTENDVHPDLSESIVTNTLVVKDEFTDDDNEESTIKIKKKNVIHIDIDEDVYDSEELDTDLEDEDDSTNTRSDSTIYEEYCSKLGIIPVSYFTRHLEEKEISMRHHGLGLEGTRAIVKILQENSTVEKLDLDGNSIGEDGVKYIAKLLTKNEYVSELSLADNGLRGKGATHLCSALVDNKSLKRLNISGNGFQDKDAHLFSGILEENKSLRELSLAYNSFGENAGQLLGPAIGLNDMLSDLNLSWNNLRRKGAVAIAKGITENILIQKCNLAWNGFGQDGGMAIAEMLLVNSSLSELDISGNRLTVDVAMKIAKALNKNDNLVKLKMGNNPISTTGCIAIINAINSNEQSSLELLDLSDIPVEYEFLRIADEIKQKNKFTVMHGPVIRSGNTADDIGKRSVDASQLMLNPLIVLKNSIVVTDGGISDLLFKYDPEKTRSVTAEDFIKVLQELKVPFTKPQLESIVSKLDKNRLERIDYGSFIQLSKTKKVPPIAKLQPIPV